MIEVELKDEELVAGLDRLARHLTDLTPLMQEIGEVMVESTKQRFLAGTSPEGVPWAPKSAATLEAYAARGDSIDFRPLFGPSRRLSSEISYLAGPESVEIGSALIYAGVHQFGAAEGAFGTMANGSPIPWGDIPARPFLGISEQDRTNVLAAIDEWLARVVDAAD